MTLLTSMMERPLDPGYAAAAEVRQRAGLPATTGIRTPAVLVAAVVTGLLLTLGALALRAPSTSAVKARAELIAQIQGRRSAADTQAAQLRSLQTQVDTLQSQALGQDQSAMQARLAALSLVSGADAVTGPGIRVVLDDAPAAHGNSADGNPRTDAQKNDGKVLSKDMQIIVDGLWQAGGEAIAVNGQRLTSKSAIRFAGEAILVNYRPLTRPYTIDVIGSSTDLQTEFADNDGGSYARALKDNYGIRVSIDGVPTLTLPAATTLTVRYATVPAQDSSSRTTNSTKDRATTTTAPTTTAPTTTAPTTSPSPTPTPSETTP
jgi:uncharacterized protein YlxW (UPF0749 family)